MPPLAVRRNTKAWSFQDLVAIILHAAKIVTTSGHRIDIDQFTIHLNQLPATQPTGHRSGGTGGSPPISDDAERHRSASNAGNIPAPPGTVRADAAPS